MTSRATPYLSFDGNASEAMQFYQSIFRGSLAITTFGDLRRTQDPAHANLVAHSTLKGATGLVLMGSDVSDPGDYRSGSSMSVALGGDEAELTEYWGKLSERGRVTVPFALSAWGAMHGQCIDRFGTAWLLNVVPSMAGGAG